jgi:ankyrin repeat protein
MNELTVDCVKKLLELNLNPKDKDLNDHDSLDLANIHNRQDIISFFETKGYTIIPLTDDERKLKKEEQFKKCQQRMKLKKQSLKEKVILYKPKNEEIFKFSSVMVLMI